MGAVWREHMVAAYSIPTTARIIRFAQFDRDSSTVRLVRHSRSAQPSDFRGCSKFEDAWIPRARGITGWSTLGIRQTRVHLCITFFHAVILTCASNCSYYRSLPTNSKPSLSNTGNAVRTLSFSSSAPFRETSKPNRTNTVYYTPRYNVQYERLEREPD